MKKFLTLATILGLGLYANESSAQLFRLKPVGYGNLTNEQQTAWKNKLAELEADINKDFPSSINPNRFMQGMANSSVMAGKGIGSDYASRMEVALVGGGAGASADLEEDKSINSKGSGAGAQGGFIVGTNLSWMDAEKILGLYTDRLNIYTNFLIFNYERDLGGEDNKASGKFSSFGAHVSYDLVLPKGNSLLRWGGIKVHTGYEYNSTQLRLSTSFLESVDENLGGATVEGDVKGKPSGKIDVITHSIPIEISTNVQILYFLSLYSGLGVDVNFGSAKGDGNADTSILDVDIDNDGDVDENLEVQAEANLDGSGNANSFLYRAFAGVQINIPYMNIFVQADKAIGTELVAATAGVRFVY